MPICIGPTLEVSNNMETPPATLAEAFQAQSVHSQDLSPLFNKLPSEIRNLIYEYAFTEDPAAPPSAHNFAVQPNHEETPLPAEVTRDSPPPNTDGTLSTDWYLAPVRTTSDWVRPDCPGAAMPTDLLRTCKRIYLEARGLPIPQKEFRFYFYRGPKEQPDYITQADFERFFNQTLAQWSSVPNYRRLDLVSRSFLAFLRSWERWQRLYSPAVQVRSVRLFAQMFWLEDRSNRNLSWICSQTDYFSKVENLRITFRRSDWWWWEDNRPPLISPFRVSSIRCSPLPISAQILPVVPSLHFFWPLSLRVLRYLLLEYLPTFSRLLTEDDGRATVPSQRHKVRWKRIWRRHSAVARFPSHRAFGDLPLNGCPN